MTIGSIVSLAHNESDQRKINFAVQQLLQRNGGQQVNSVVTTTSDYTARDSDFLILISGNSRFSPTSASAAPGQLFCVKKTDSSATTATIDNGINTTDGSTSVSLTSSGQVVMIESDGTQYQSLIHTTAVDLSVVLHTTNALSELSTNAAAARSNIGSAASTATLQTTNALSELSTSAATARTNISAAGTAQTFLDGMNGFVSAPVTSSIFDIYGSAPFSATITKITAVLLAGSGTLVFSINGTPIGGGSISASTTRNSVTPTSANSFSNGDAVTMQTTSVSAPSQLFYTLALSRSLTLS